jgi:hypothetical protein
MLFADLKDSTELIRGLDPEAAQRLLDPALRLMDAAHHFEGTVNQVLGDGIMALFGAPIAHEDHALRACYAALAMQAAKRAYTQEVRRAHGLEMHIRVGLYSGEVVVRAIGNGLYMDYSANWWSFILESKRHRVIRHYPHGVYRYGIRRRGVQASSADYRLSYATGTRNTVRVVSNAILIICLSQTRDFDLLRMVFGKVLSTSERNKKYGSLCGNRHHFGSSTRGDRPTA